MLESETDTTYEGFTGGSLVHEAGAVPTYFLSRYVLGVRNSGTFPNRRIVIEPHLGDLQHAEGVVLTDFGSVSVSWRTNGNDLEFSFDVPANAEADVALPYRGDAPGLVLNGQTPIDGGMVNDGFSVDGSRIRFQASAGKYEGRVDSLR